MRARLLVLLIAAGLGAGLASAQESGRPLSGPAWRQQQLVDLAEVLGGAHYLRILCAGRGDQRWRDYMRGVIDREPSMRRALSDSFNDGYRNEAARFVECDAASRQTEAELRARGLRIAGALSARAGGD